MESTELGLLREQWRVVATSLGIDFVAPILLPLPDGGQFEFAGLLPQFGAAKGMLITPEYSAPAFEAARSAGYGVSCMRGERHHLPINPEKFVDCLVDWAWVAQEAAPAWYANAA